MSMSPSSAPIFVFRSSANRFLMSASSSLINARIFLGSFRRAFRRLIVACSSRCSSSSFSRSSRVRRRSGMSRMWFAWISESLKRVMSLRRASSASAEPRMILMTASRLASAISSPSTIWSRSSAFFSSYFVRRVTTSTWCSM